MTGRNPFPFSGPGFSSSFTLCHCRAWCALLSPAPGQEHPEDAAAWDPLPHDNAGAWLSPKAEWHDHVVALPVWKAPGHLGGGAAPSWLLRAPLGLAQSIPTWTTLPRSAPSLQPGCFKLNIKLNNKFCNASWLV